MTTAASDSTPKLPVLATVGSAYTEVFGRPWRLIKTIAIPVVLILAIGEGSVLLEERLPEIGWLFYPAQLLPFVLFSLFWQRELILGAESGGLRRAVTPRRLGLTFLYPALASLVLVAPWIFFLASVMGAASLGLPGWFEISGVGQMRGGFGAAYIMLVGVVARCSLVFPACAVDAPFGLKESWNATDGHSFRLLGATVLAGLPVVILVLLMIAVLAGAVRGIDSLSPEVLEGPNFWIGIFGLALIADILQLVGMAIIASIFTVAYRRLSYSDQARVELLERFE